MNSLQTAFADHSRRWRQFRYVYPVIARRSRGLSLGINLNPDGACSFDCVYCCVDRSAALPPAGVDLALLGRELQALARNWRALFQEPEFESIPAEFRRLNDFAFSGDGEPTLAAEFPAAVDLAVAVRREERLDDVRIVVITNTTGLTRPDVAAALRVLDANNGEIWAKLDAGTEEYFTRVDRTRYGIDRVLANILTTARLRPVVIQSLFMRIDGEPPPPEEIAAYIEHLNRLRAAGAQLRLVQVYTVARRTAESNIAPLTGEELATIAAQVRAIGIPADVFP